MSAVRPVDAGSNQALLCDAAALVIESQYAHHSMLQRKLKVGYAMADRLLNLLEEAGVVGPYLTSGLSRDVLVRSSGLSAALATLREEVSR